MTKIFRRATKVDFFGPKLLLDEPKNRTFGKIFFSKITYKGYFHAIFEKFSTKNAKYGFFANPVYRLFITIKLTLKLKHEKTNAKSQEIPQSFACLNLGDPKTVLQWTADLYQQIPM
jgi:hypothetical protein